MGRSTQIAIGRRTAGRGLTIVVAFVFAVLSLQIARPARTDAASIALSSTPAPAREPGFGVQYHVMWSDYTDEQRMQVFDKLAAAHVRWVRLDMGWSSFMEHCDGCISQWYVKRADMVVNAALARGMKVLVTLWRTPHWENNAGSYDPPVNAAKYGDIAFWAASHFKGRVSAWEIWNEPNLDDFWTGTPQQYAALVKAGYPRFKAADPAAQVLVGATAYNDTNYLRQLFEAGIAGNFDGISTHPYQAPTDLPPEVLDTKGTNIWLIDHVRAVRSLMAEYGDGDKTVWFTEFGWSTHANTPDTLNWMRGVTEEQQADYLLRAINFIGENYPYVPAIFWYNERNRASGDLQVDNYGLLYRDLKGKPAYRALLRSNVGCTILGTGGDDVLTGTSGDDMICSGGGNDVVNGGGGNDVVFAGSGADAIYGGGGNDVLWGGVGSDPVLDGGSGNDMVRGGGHDDLVRSADGVGGNDSLYGGGGTDTCDHDSGDVATTCP